MDTIYQRCCGLDIHKKVVVACLITPGPKGEPHKEIRSFGTMTVRRRRIGIVGLAGGCQVHPCGHGKHGGVLETDIQPVGRQL